MVPPFSSDWYPFLCLTSQSEATGVPVAMEATAVGVQRHNSERKHVGLAIGVPMERTVYITRADYTPLPRTDTDRSPAATATAATGGLLSISFDLAISPRSAVYNRSSAFSFVRTTLHHTTEQ
jgi:hypothetical protein